MVEGGMKCVKYLLFLFNLLFFLAGLGLIITGAVIQTKYSSYFDFFGNSFGSVAVLLIIIGAIIFVIGFFGCCGAYKENYCMVMTFAVLLAIIFIMEIAAGIAAYVLRNQLQGEILKNMEKTMLNYGKVEGVTKTWDLVQHEVKCCGSTNYTAWEGKGNLTSNSVPDSCCKTFVQGCGKDQITQAANIYTKGCVNGVLKFAKDNIYIVGAVGIGVAFVQIVGVMLACCLGRTIKKEYEVV